jgi:hypothetical protein
VKNVDNVILEKIYLESVYTINLNGLQLVDIINGYKIVDLDGRKIVLIDLNGFKMPFYLSSGLGQKSSVAKNQWYPFLGLGSKWINKTSQKEINNYYNIPLLRHVANILDYKNLKDFPPQYYIEDANMIKDAINKDLIKLGIVPLNDVPRTSLEMQFLRSNLSLLQVKLSHPLAHISNK